MFDSVYRKDGNYYAKVFLEKFIHKFFWRSIINVDFWGFGSSPRNIRNFLSLELESFISLNIRNFLRVGSFYLLSSESYFLKYKKFFWVSSNIRNFSRCFRFPKYKKSFLLRKKEISIS